MQDSALAGQGAGGMTATRDSAAAGQDAGRLNGMMRTLGRRTTERDAARAEVATLRAQLAREVEASLQPQPDEREDAQQPPQQRADGEAGAEAGHEPEPGPDGYVRLEDGSAYRPGSVPASGIAPTQPRRAQAQPATSDLDYWRGRFEQELPAFAEDLADRLY